MQPCEFRFGISDIQPRWAGSRIINRMTPSSQKKPQALGE